MKKLAGILSVVFLLIFISCSREKKEEEKDCCKAKDSLSAESNSQSGESLYQLSGSWITENQKTIELNQLKGKIQVVSMIFSHCEYACPRLVADMKIIEEKIPAEKRDQVNFLLVSFDVDRDSPERLKEFKTEQGLGENWKLLHGDESMVRMLSVLLDIKYEKQSNGNFAHSNIISVLDQNGVIRARIDGLGADPSKALQTINKLLK